MHIHFLLLNITTCLAPYFLTIMQWHREQQRSRELFSQLYQLLYWLQLQLLFMFLLLHTHSIFFHLVLYIQLFGLVSFFLPFHIPIHPIILYYEAISTLLSFILFLLLCCAAFIPFSDLNSNPTNQPTMLNIYYFSDRRTQNSLFSALQVLHQFKLLC